MAPDHGAAVTTGSREPRLGVRAAVLLFATVAVVHALSPSVQVGDSRLSVPVATQIVRHGTLDLERVPTVTSLTNHYDVRAHDSHLVPFFPWPAMLFAIPGAVAFDAVGKDPASLKPSDPNQTWEIEVPTASVLVGATAVVIALIAFESIGGALARRRRSAVVIGLLFAFATGAWSTGSRALWQHTPSMLFLALALYFALRIERRGAASPVLLGLSLGAAYAVRPTNAVALIAFSVWVLVCARRRAPLVLAGIAAVLVPFVLVNLAAYGSLLPSYYAGSRLGSEVSIPFADAAAMYLVSPSRGLLVYDPLILLSAVGAWLLVRRRAFGALHATVALVVVGQWLVIARYGSTGGSSYGPRLLTDILPFVVFLAIPAVSPVLDGRPWRSVGPRRSLAVALVGVVIAWSVAVNASGALLRSAYCWSATPVHVDVEPSRAWQWNDPQFLRPLKVWRDGGSLHDVVLESCPGAASTATG